MDSESKSKISSGTSVFGSYKFSFRIRKHKVFLIILAVHIFLMMLNKNNSPFLFIDENLYTARAWSFYRFHEIDIPPTGYDYDHPFLGWIIIALFFHVIKGGYYFQRARTVMIIFSAIKVTFTYLIPLKYLRNKKTANFSAAVMGFSIGFIDLSRLVLLDNVGITFILAAIYFFNINKKWYISAI